MRNSEEVITKHPSFGVVRLSRTSGNANLFGSSVPHQHYITLTICHGEFSRDLHCDKIHAGDEIIRVAMSGIQLGDMLTNMNVHSGTPCTIQRVMKDGEYAAVERPPEHLSTKATYAKDFSDRLKTMASDMREVLAQAADLKDEKTIKKADFQKIVNNMNGVLTELTANLPFVMEMFNERIEKVASEAKAEVEAFQSAMITNLGIEALHTRQIEGK